MTITRRLFLANVSAAALSLAQPAAAQSVRDLMSEPAHGDMELGSSTASVTVVEYASASCPHCRAFHEDVFMPLKPAYLDTGKVRFIFREFPHNDLGLAAFMLARCSPKERYFPIVDVIFKTQDKWMANPLPELMKIAQQAGLTAEAFDACLRNETVAKDIIGAKEKASAIGIDSVPALFINGERYEGETTFDAFKLAIDDQLARS